jgi:hypothetical protein
LELCEVLSDLVEIRLTGHGDGKRLARPLEDLGACVTIHTRTNGQRQYVLVSEGHVPLDQNWPVDTPGLRLCHELIGVGRCHVAAEAQQVTLDRITLPRSRFDRRECKLVEVIGGRDLRGTECQAKLHDRIDVETDVAAREVDGANGGLDGERRQLPRGIDKCLGLAERSPRRVRTEEQRSGLAVDEEHEPVDRPEFADCCGNLAPRVDLPRLAS